MKTSLVAVHLVRLRLRQLLIASLTALVLLQAVALAAIHAGHAQRSWITGCRLVRPVTVEEGGVR